ncbi:FtsK/SpoIIIE domain-containing protein [Ruminococcus sp.]|uniref:FtsK/SpoIIIE domain-containing protein n=1 Tax=Ruminococcus sp. TaxID=41978 RepID=UPI00388F0F93
MSNSIMLGFDYLYWQKQGVKIPVQAPLNAHYIVVGGSGSGKSTALLYWLYKARPHKVDLYIADFKASREFSGITPHFAEFEDCYDLIKAFYQEFQNTPEGGGGTIKVILIDEIAGLLTHFSMTKEGKAKADQLRMILSSILMLGRSRQCFVWLSMQRYSASIFPSSSGSADNFHVTVGLGRLTVDGRKGLFAGEHFEGEDTLQFGQARGIVLVDGQPLRSLIIPKVSKRKLLALLQQ